jgi:rare lipoprotein A
MLPGAPAPLKPHSAFLLPVALAAATLAGCATKRIIIQEGHPPAIYDSKPMQVLEGKASWYGGRWIGRLTANGERYKPDDLTAAHKTLPFNSMVRVTNLRNSKSVIVRINNRGPYVRGRIIDLSIVAARKLDMMKDGVARVRIEVLRPIHMVDKPNLHIDERARQRASAYRQPQAQPIPSRDRR